MAVRRIVWRVFCPHCLTAVEGHAHEGVADRVATLDCVRCRKRYVVQTGVRGDGMPLCDSTPVAVRSPEVLEDNQPIDLP